MSGNGESAEQKRRMRVMFDSVAHRYDFLNHFLSAGIDTVWRKRAVDALELRPGQIVLDLCAGTGDLGLTALAREAVKVVGVDLARNMLMRGLGKSENGSYLFVQGDAERVPLSDAAVDR